MRSTDGRRWTNNVTGGSGLSDIAYGNGYFVAVGGGRRMRSADGITWQNEVTGGSARSIVFTGEEFFAAGGREAYTSVDGREWTAHALAVAVDLVAYADGIYVGAAWSPQATTLLRSTDGRQWERIASGGNSLTDLVGVSRQ
ncbi:MAG: hypothetical protein H5U40_06570 [Polyangiaceae bacterium]|nr:hypothetical protein [Polyangiaceae bacterium]